MVFTIPAWRVFFELAHFVFECKARACRLVSKVVLSENPSYVAVVWRTCLAFFLFFW
jgi:hypothetical protein